MEKQNKKKHKKLSRKQINTFMQKARQIIDVSVFKERAVETNNQELYIKQQAREADLLASFANESDHLKRKLISFAKEYGLEEKQDHVRQF